MNAVSSSFSDTFASQANLAMSQSQSKSLNAPSARDPETMRPLAEKFTGMFVSQMFQHMFEGVGKDTLFGGGAGEDMFKSTLVDEYGKAAAKQGGMGLTDKILHSLISQQEVKS